MRGGIYMWWYLLEKKNEKIGLPGAANYRSFVYGPAIIVGALDSMQAKPVIESHLGRVLPVFFFFFFLPFFCYSSILKPIRYFPSFFVCVFTRWKNGHYRTYGSFFFVSFQWYTGPPASARPGHGCESTKTHTIFFLFFFDVYICPAKERVLARLFSSFYQYEIAIYPTPRMYTTEPRVRCAYKLRGVV